MNIALALIGAVVWLIIAHLIYRRQLRNPGTQRCNRCRAPISRCGWDQFTDPSGRVVIDGQIYRACDGCGRPVGRVLDSVS